MRKGRKRRDTYSWVLRGLVGVAGFILSPLSWWNDLFVNIPLAYGIAWLAGRTLSLFLAVHRELFVHLFVAGYFLTNLAGFLMIHFSLFGFGGERGVSLKKQIVVALIYSLAIYLFFGLGLCRPEEGCAIFPSWVRE